MSKKEIRDAKKRNKDRGNENTTMTISLPKKLKDAITKAAESENRKVSNFLVTELVKIIDESQPSSGPPPKGV